MSFDFLFIYGTTETYRTYTCIKSIYFKLLNLKYSSSTQSNVMVILKPNYLNAFTLFNKQRFLLFCCMRIRLKSVYLLHTLFITHSV